MVLEMQKITKKYNPPTLGCGRPTFIQYLCWEELCSPYEVAKPQPSTG